MPYRRGHQKSSYILQLLKASLFMSVAPFIVLAVYAVNNWLDLRATLYAGTLIYLITLIFVRPYVADLVALTTYVEDLALDKKEKAPELSFLSNVLALSDAVKHLQGSWEERKMQLEGIIIESKIVFDTLPDIIVMIDKNRMVLRTNNTAHTLLGAHLYRRQLEHVIQDDHLMDVIEEVMAGAPGQKMEIYLKDPINRHYIVSVERFPILSKGGIAAIIVMHDITDTKRNEKMFADFVANASHEIRTPLTSIIGFIETLQTAAKDDPAAHERFLKIMAEQATRMSSLVSELLSLSNIERNVSTVPTDMVNLRPIIEGACNHLEWAAKEKEIAIVNRVPAEIPDIVGDQNQLMQVMSNLVSNAIKYSLSNTTVTIYANITDHLPLDSKMPRGVERALAITVEDEGEGIAPEHISRLTERFYRVDKARSRKVGGSGLGLSIVKHIMNRHRGALGIESDVGKGSRFTVYLPITNKLS